MLRAKRTKQSPLDGPKDMTGARLEVLGKVRGLDVVLVDGKKVRKGLDVNFTMGGNSARYGYVPPGEVWVEKALDDEDRAAAIVYEVTEYHRMTTRGEPYEDAHERAAELETLFRDELLLDELERAHVIDVATQFLEANESESDIELGKHKNKVPRKEHADDAPDVSEDE